jgi:hypothetical protein
MKKKSIFVTIGIIVTTVILAGVAIVTAYKLYQTRQTAVTPNAPESKPRADNDLSRDPICRLDFTITLTTASPSPTATPTATPTVTATATATSTATATVTASPSPTATPNPQCNNSCTSNSNCPSGLMCYIPSGQTAGNCRNTQCLSETDCSCPVATPTATAQPVLPKAGTSWPTVLGTGFGVMVIIGSLFLAL